MKIRRLAGALLLATLIGGCSSGVATPATRTPVDQLLFSPTAMRLHPVFTQVRDWTGDGQPDGIEAVVEIQDQFGDPTKAAGRILFELYTYRPYNPDPRGPRLANPWEGRLDSMEDQRARWNRVNRAYIFQLAFPQARSGEDYVLAATFELSSGGRFFDRTIIEGERTRPGPSTGPAPLPGARNARPDQSPADPSPADGGRRSAKPGAIITRPGTQTEPASVPSSDHQPPPRNDQP